MLVNSGQDLNATNCGIKPRTNIPPTLSTTKLEDERRFVSFPIIGGSGIVSPLQNDRF